MTSQVNPEYVNEFERQGLTFVGRDTEGSRMEILEIPGNFFLSMTSLPRYYDVTTPLL